MAGSALWSSEDEAIMATNGDATECKRCAVELGYWKDDYVGYFAKHVDRKAPEINRGYYARVRAMELFVHQFLERCGSRCQIVNLGCGFDTLYWRLRDTTRAVGNFVELDLPSVAARKVALIKRTRALLQRLAADDGDVALRGGELHAAGYHLLGCDLRSPPSVRRALQAAAALPDDGPPPPTLFLAECVLVYLRPEPAAALLRMLSQLYPTSMMVVYEQCNLDDRFGAVMVANLARRGCGLAGADTAREGPDAVADRLRAAGWPSARAWPMHQVWSALPSAERAAASARDPLDEPELLHQLHAHYALAAASSGDLLADLDLERADLAALFAQQ